MYAVYKQAHPPTGLEFSMYCNFFNNSERNLVVAGTSQLYVYRLNRDAEVGAGRAGPSQLPAASRVLAEGGARRRSEKRAPPSAAASGAALSAPQRSACFPLPAPVRLLCSSVFTANHASAYCVLGSGGTAVNKSYQNSAAETAREVETHL